PVTARPGRARPGYPRIGPGAGGQADFHQGVRLSRPGNLWHQTVPALSRPGGLLFRRQSEANRPHSSHARRSTTVDVSAAAAHVGWHVSRSAGASRRRTGWHLLPSRSGLSEMTAWTTAAVPMLSLAA